MANNGFEFRGNCEELCHVFGENGIAFKVKNGKLAYFEYDSRKLVVSMCYSDGKTTQVVYTCFAFRHTSLLKNEAASEYVVRCLEKSGKLIFASAGNDKPRSV